MGAACCGLAGAGERRKKRSTRRRSKKNPHSATEPLLRDNEREAVSSLLRYLEGGKYRHNATRHFLNALRKCLFCNHNNS